MFFDQTLLGDFSRADKIKNESFERAAKRFRVSLVQDLLHDEGSGKEDKELAPAPANKDASVQVTLRLQYPCLIGPWNTL